MTESCRQGFKLEALRRLFDFKGRRRRACDAAAAALAAESASKGVVGRLHTVAQNWGLLPRVGEPLGPHHAAMSATTVLLVFWACRYLVQSIVAYLAHRRARNRMAEAAVAAAAAQAEEDAAWERRLQHQLPASMRKQAEAMVAQLHAVEREAFAVIRAKEERIVALAAGVTAAQAAAQASTTYTSIGGDVDRAVDPSASDWTKPKSSHGLLNASGVTAAKASVLSADTESTTRVQTPEKVRSGRLWQLPDVEGRPISPIATAKPQNQSSALEPSNDTVAAESECTLSTPPKAESDEATSPATLPGSEHTLSTDASPPVTSSPDATPMSEDCATSEKLVVTTEPEHVAQVESSSELIEPENSSTDSAVAATTTTTTTTAEPAAVGNHAAAAQALAAAAQSEASDTSAAADAAAQAASVARAQALVEATRAAQAEASQLTAQLNVLRSARTAAHAAAEALSLELAIGPVDNDGEDGKEGDEDVDGEPGGGSQDEGAGESEEVQEGDSTVNKPAAIEKKEPVVTVGASEEIQANHNQASSQNGDEEIHQNSSDLATTTTTAVLATSPPPVAPPVLPPPLPTAPLIPNAAMKPVPSSVKSLSTLRALPRRTQSETPRGSVHTVPETPQSFGQRIKALFGKSVDLPVEPLPVSHTTDNSIGQVSALEARLTALEMDSAQANAKEAAAAEYRRVLSAAEVFRSELAAELGRGYASSREESDSGHAGESDMGNDDISIDISLNGGGNVEDNDDEEKDDEAEISGEDYDLGAAALNEALLLLGLPSSRDTSTSRASTPLSQEGMNDKKHSSSSGTESAAFLAHSRTLPRSAFRSLDANQAASTTTTSSAESAHGGTSSSVLWRPVARGRRSSSADKEPPPPSPPLPSPSQQQQQGPHVVRASTPRPASSSVDRPPLASSPAHRSFTAAAPAAVPPPPAIAPSQSFASGQKGAAQAPPPRNNHRFESGNKASLEPPGNEETSGTTVEVRNEALDDGYTLPVETQHDSDSDSNDLFNVLGLNGNDDKNRSSESTVDNKNASNPDPDSGGNNDLNDDDEEDEDDARFARLAASAAFFNNEVAAAARGFSEARSDSIASSRSYASSNDRSSVDGSPYSPSARSSEDSTQSNNDGRDNNSCSISPIGLRGLNSADSSPVTSPTTPLPSPDDELVSEKRPPPTALLRSSSTGVEKVRGSGWTRRFSLSALRWTNSGQA